MSLYFHPPAPRVVAHHIQGVGQHRTGHASRWPRRGWSSLGARSAVRSAPQEGCARCFWVILRIVSQTNKQTNNQPTDRPTKQASKQARLLLRIQPRHLHLPPLTSSPPCPACSDRNLGGLQENCLAGRPRFTSVCRQTFQNSQKAPCSHCLSLFWQLAGEETEKCMHPRNTWTGDPGDRWNSGDPNI